MRRQAIVRTLMLAMLGMFVASAALAEDLRWKFKAGEPLNYILERGTEGKIVLSGAEIKFNMKMIFDTTWNAVTVADDGTAAIELSVDRIQINMSSPLFGSMVYDSKGSEEPKGPVWEQMKGVMAGMRDGKFKLKISPQGETSDIALPENLAKSLAAQEIGENRRAGFGIGGNPFGEKGIKELIAKSVLQLPKKEGEWLQTFTNEMPGLGVQTAETKFEAAGTESKDGKELAKITSVTELMFEPEEAPKAELEIMSQEAAATYYFDPQAGHLVSSEGTQQVGMELTGPQEVKQDIKETTSMKLGKSPDQPAAAPSEGAKKDGAK